MTTDTPYHYAPYGEILYTQMAEYAHQRANLQALSEMLNRFTQGVEAACQHLIQVNFTFRDSEWKPEDKPILLERATGKLGVGFFTPHPDTGFPIKAVKLFSKTEETLEDFQAVDRWLVELLKNPFVQERVYELLGTWPPQPRTQVVDITQAYPHSIRQMDVLAETPEVNPYCPVEMVVGTTQFRTIGQIFEKSRPKASPCLEVPYALGVRGDTIITFVTFMNHPEDEGHAVHLYHQDTATGQYTFVRALCTPKGRSSDEGFGEALSASQNGRILAIGVPEGRILGVATGLVYLYEDLNYGPTEGPNYQLVATLTPPISLPGIQFGRKVNVSDDGAEITVNTKETSLTYVRSPKLNNGNHWGLKR
jgi:hypothetical protein